MRACRADNIFYPLRPLFVHYSVFFCCAVSVVVFSVSQYFNFSFASFKVTLCISYWMAISFRADSANAFIFSQSFFSISIILPSCSILLQSFLQFLSFQALRL